ncbi:MAG: glycosyltransferase family 39 protein [Cyanobacteria bacterium P01_G01_bin.38]
MSEVTGWQPLWVGLIFLGIAHVVYSCFAFPNPDEAYYWLWGQHLDWSYYDHPPFHAWVQGGFAALLGTSRGVVRLPTLLSNGLLLWSYYQIARDLYGKQAGLAWGIIVASLLASPLYFVFLTLAWPDQWLLAFSLLSAHWGIRFFDQYRQGEGNSTLLYGAGLALGLACLCKYTAVFVGLAAIATLLSDRQLRPLLREGRLYRAGAIVALATLPILIWNYQNDWLSFQYYLTRSVDSGGTAVKPLEVLSFWGLSILIVSPFLSWPFLQLLRSQPLRQSQSSLGPFTIGLFALSTGVLSGVGLFSTALYYWNILAYVLLVVWLPTYFLGIGSGRSKATPWRHLGLWRWAQGFGGLVATLLVVNYCVLPISALFGPDGDPDGRMLFGWDTVGPTVQAVQQEQTVAEGKPPLLLTTDYRSASALAFALNDPGVLAVSERIDQFDIWAKRRPLAGRSALILSDDWHPLTAALNQQFEQVRPVATVPVQRWGVPIKTYYLHFGEGFEPLPRSPFTLRPRGMADANALPLTPLNACLMLALKPALSPLV